MKRHIVSFIALLFCSSALAESYLCIADLATGFTFDEKTREWRQAKFKADKKYIISKNKDGGNAWMVKEMGKKFPNAWCGAGFNDVGWLYCGEKQADFRMNKENLRFLAFYPFGYWTTGTKGFDKPVREGEDTPFIEIGKCTILKE